MMGTHESGSLIPKNGNLKLDGMDGKAYVYNCWAGESRQGIRGHEA